jgi:hypothetical protein
MEFQELSTLARSASEGNSREHILLSLALFEVFPWAYAHGYMLSPLRG